MSALHFEPNAVYHRGEVSYLDAEALRRDLEPFLSRRVLCVMGLELPALLEDIPIRLFLPGGAALDVVGHVISLREETALIQVGRWTDQAWRAIETAAGLAPGSMRRPPENAPEAAPAARRVMSPAALAPASGLAAPQTLRSPSSFEPAPGSAPPHTARSASAHAPEAANGSPALRDVRPRTGVVARAPAEEPQASAPPRVRSDFAPKPTPPGRAVARPAVPRPPPQRRETLPLFQSVAPSAEPPRREHTEEPALASRFPTIPLGAAGAESLRAILERKRRANAFEALGAHYTDSPRKLEAAHRRAQATFGPESPANAHDPEHCTLILGLIEDAWAKLRDHASRERYRRDVLGVDVEGAAQLLAEQAKLRRVRGADDDARELLEAALDLHRCYEYLEALRAIDSGPPSEPSVDAVRLVDPRRRLGSLRLSRPR